ncbi:hypothetical protein [Actinocorallia longicatena]|uniref:Transporter substrate-binding domain-containing protein n=1 Tax=Actinocorallia longicatena TaxID=111803 RepID=A0ABP6QGF9_9ACTN
MLAVLVAAGLLAVPAGPAAADCVAPAGRAASWSGRDVRCAVPALPAVPVPAERPDGRIAMTPTPGEVSAEPRPDGEMPWRSPVYGALVLLLFALLGAHRLVTRSEPALAAESRAAPTGQRSAVSHVEDTDTVGVTGPGGDGFLRAVLVELVTRGGGQVVLGRAELDRLFGGRLERGVLAALAPRLRVRDRLADVVEYLELELLLEGEDLHWFVAPGTDADAVRPLLASGRLRALVLGPWERTRHIDGQGILDGQLVPTLTSAEAAERLHLYTLTL